METHRVLSRNYRFRVFKGELWLCLDGARVLFLAENERNKMGSYVSGAGSELTFRRPRRKYRHLETVLLRYPDAPSRWSIVVKGFRV
jgi:hypothetical protein